VFGRRKPGSAGSTANRLGNQAEPNKLTWVEAEPAEASPAEAVDDEVDGLEPDSPEIADAEADDEEARLRAARLQAELQREAEEFGLTTDDPKRKYGPNGEKVAAILAALADLEDEKAVALTDEYDAVPEDEFQAAHSAVLERFGGSGHEPYLRAAEYAISDWLASVNLAVEVPVYSTVADIATDAVDALILEDLLSDAEFETLHGPWSRVMQGGPHAVEAGSIRAEEPVAEPEDQAEGEPEGEFGPNSDLVLQFLERLEALTPGEIAVLVAAWGRQHGGAIRAAHANLQSIADEDPEWHEQIHRAQEEVASWTLGKGGRRGYLGGDVPEVPAPVREPAGPAVADAIGALVMADVLEREDAETLYAPWAEVIGWPAFPTYEGDGESDT
jgi:hypothetical protein